MTDSTATERLLFPEIFAKPVMLEFDQRQGSSDGGAVLLKAAERRYGLIASMSGCIDDPRQAGKVDHSLRDLFAQRVFSIGCGYADANDSARLAADPMHKMLLDRDPVTGLDTASQPTLSRFENSRDLIPNVSQETLTGRSAPPLGSASALGISKVDYQLQ